MALIREVETLVFLISLHTQFCLVDVIYGAEVGQESLQDLQTSEMFL